MRPKFDAILAMIMAITLVTGGLWLWNGANHSVGESDNFDRSLWAARCGAVAAIAGAQVLGLGVIARAFFDRDKVSEVARAAAALVCAAATIGTLTLVWTVS